MLCMQVRRTRYVSKMKALASPDAICFPYFGHALALARECPWDLMEKWIRQNDGKMILMEFMNKVESDQCLSVSHHVVPLISYVMSLEHILNTSLIHVSSCSMGLLLRTRLC